VQFAHEPPQPPVQASWQVPEQVTELQPGLPFPTQLTQSELAPFASIELPEHAWLPSHVTLQANPAAQVMAPVQT
jgi:hypothetical protein